MGQLARFDRRNQRAADTMQQRDDDRRARRRLRRSRGLRWEQSGSAWAVQADRGQVEGRLVMDEDGVICRRMLVECRHPWGEIAVISWSSSKTGNFLCVCRYGARRPLRLGGVWVDEQDVRDLLPPIREFVESRGAEIVDRGYEASMWWSTDPRSKSAAAH